MVDGVEVVVEGELRPVGQAVVVRHDADEFVVEQALGAQSG